MTAKKKNRAATPTMPEAVGAPAVESTATASGMVTVAYNSPQAIVFTLGKRNIHINGNAPHLIGKEKGIIPVGRFGYTRIAAEDWAAIVKTYGSMAIFKNNLIFAEKSRDRAEDRAEEAAETRHGLEPVDTKNTVTEEAQAEA